MMKSVLLAGAMIAASPALAQTTAGQTAPAAAPTTSAPATTTAPSTAPAAAPVAQQPAQTAQPAQPTQQAAAGQTATQPAAAGATQVAQVVDQEFPTYDANKDGILSSTEFDAWMVALKKASDPTVTATSPDTVKWNQAAFAQADTDKNKSISKAELTAFLGKAAG